MRISDWSSDVCSSDLRAVPAPARAGAGRRQRPGPCHRALRRRTPRWPRLGAVRARRRQHLFRRTAGRAGFREPGMSQKDILLVEDNPDDVEMTRIAFAEAKVANRLEVVGDGAPALDYLFARGEYAHRDPGDLPSIVLLDLNLPHVPGRAVDRHSGV